MLPPLNLSASSGASTDARGSTWGGMDNSGWSVNLGGSGTSYQSASATPTVAGMSGTLIWVAVALGAAWLLMRK